MKTFKKMFLICSVFFMCLFGFYYVNKRRLTITPSVCDRTPKIRDAIIRSLPPVTMTRKQASGKLMTFRRPIPCDKITKNDLATIKEFDPALLTKIGRLRLGDFEGLSNLRELEIPSFSLKGSLPKDLGNLKELRRLEIEHSQLSGSIPKELGNLGNLVELNLSGNKLSGSIPKELGNLGNLAKLNLSKNELKGSIPKELGNLKKLTKLDLYENQLSGSIPKELGGLENLEHFGIFHNKLSGSIPKELGNLKKLKVFLLSFNKFEGAIPKELINRRKNKKIVLNAFANPLANGDAAIEKLKKFCKKLQDKNTRDKASDEQRDAKAKFLKCDYFKKNTSSRPQR